jgi:hypothetical protein
MKNNPTVAGTRRSAALFSNASHQRFSKRRHARMATLTLGFLILHSSFGLRVLGQQYTVDWYKVSGGGGTSTGGVYSVSGTIGQHDAGGPMTGGNYSLTGGFWALYSVQTPGAPMLSIKLTTTNTAMVYWPSPSTGFNLQVNTSVAPANKGNWATPSQSITDNGTIKYIIVNPPVGEGFYRLKSP